VPRRVRECPPLALALCMSVDICVSMLIFTYTYIHASIPIYPCIFVCAHVQYVWGEASGQGAGASWCSARPAMELGRTCRTSDLALSLAIWARPSGQPRLFPLKSRRMSFLVGVSLPNMSASERGRLLYRQLTGPNPLNHRHEFSRPALRHGSLNSPFQVA
jgi:hypothetical protein